MEKKERTKPQANESLQATKEERSAMDGVRWEPVKVKQSDVAVTFQTREYPQFVVAHTIIGQDENQSRVVMHVKKLTQNMKVALTRFMAEEMSRMHAEYPSAHLWGSESPLYKNQMDIGMEYLDSTIAPILRDRVLQLLDLFSRQSMEKPDR